MMVAAEPATRGLDPAPLPLPGHTSIGPVGLPDKSDRVTPLMTSSSMDDKRLSTAPRAPTVGPLPAGLTSLRTGRVGSGSMGSSCGGALGSTTLARSSSVSVVGSTGHLAGLPSLAELVSLSVAYTKFADYRGQSQCCCVLLSQMPSPTLVADSTGTNCCTPSDEWKMQTPA